MPFGPLSANLAGTQLGQPQLIERLEQLPEQPGLEPSRLQLEIIESFIMNQTEEALAVLHGLKRLGVQLTIDDFSTDYSSLSYLKCLPLNILKIDKSSIRGLSDDSCDAAITRTIIALGRSMQLAVIARGVETEGQQSFLIHEGCGQIQGFVLSPPLSAELFASKFLKPRQPIGALRETPV